MWSPWSGAGRRPGPRPSCCIVGATLVVALVRAANACVHGAGRHKGVPYGRWPRRVDGHSPSVCRPPASRWLHARGRPGPTAPRPTLASPAMPSQEESPGELRFALGSGSGDRSKAHYRIGSLPRNPRSRVISIRQPEKCQRPPLRAEVGMRTFAADFAPADGHGANCPTERRSACTSLLDCDTVRRHGANVTNVPAHDERASAVGVGGVRSRGGCGIGEFHASR